MIRGDEDLTEGLLNSFRLEMGAQAFYSAAAEHMQDKSGAAMFRKLAEVEGKHMQKIYMLYNSFMGDRVPLPLEQFKKKMSAEYTESGKRIEAAVADMSGRFFMDVREVLKVALAEEATARKRYLRMAERAEDPSTADLYRDLSEDEEHHIAMIKSALDQAGGR
jgi:rubrerythrin